MTNEHIHYTEHRLKFKHIFYLQLKLKKLRNVCWSIQAFIRPNMVHHVYINVG